MTLGFDAETDLRALQLFGARGRDAFLECARSLSGTPGDKPAETRLTLEQLDGLSFVRVELRTREETEWDITTTTRLVVALGAFTDGVAPIDSFARLAQLIEAQAPTVASVEGVAMWLERTGLAWCPKDAYAVNNLTGEGRTRDVALFSGSSKVRKPAPAQASTVWQAPAETDAAVTLVANGADQTLYRVVVDKADGRLEASALGPGAELEVEEADYTRTQPDVDERYEDFLRDR